MKKIDLRRIKTYPLKGRKSKVKIKDFACLAPVPSSFARFLSSLPDILVGRNLRELVERIVWARTRKRPVILMFGGHLIKCGLSPLIIELIQQDIVTCLSTNGSGIIHDFEIAFAGRTSEDVREAVQDGSFGMARETGEFINQAINQGSEKGKGIGESVGEFILQSAFPYKKYSFLAHGRKANLPVTVHVGLGTDIIHQHPNCSGAALGQGSMQDFLTLSAVVSRLSGGVVLNFGSAVILPEVFIKALNLARNTGHKVEDFTVANFDMMIHYRPLENLLRRPGGRGYNFVGHHEIMFPLLVQAVREKIEGGRKG